MSNTIKALRPASRRVVMASNQPSFDAGSDPLVMPGVSARNGAAIIVSQATGVPEPAGIRALGVGLVGVQRCGESTV